MNYKTIIDSILSQIGSARLMAVSKTRSLEEIMAVYNSGVRLFGENHAQEIVEKFSEGKPKDMEVHMIGHLQSNKVGKVVPLVDMIESIDSFELLEKVNRAAEKIGKVMPVLLELNTSQEESKTGFKSEIDLLDCLNKSFSLNNIIVEGLMTVGPVNCPLNDKDKLTRTAFRQLKNLFDTNNYFKVLSMGMSGDYKIAVEEGSTEVRIGTMIFGARNYD